MIPVVANPIPFAGREYYSHPEECLLQQYRITAIFDALLDFSNIIRLKDNVIAFETSG
jgi:hypothetical protein